MNYVVVFYSICCIQHAPHLFVFRRTLGSVKLLYYRFVADCTAHVVCLYLLRIHAFLIFNDIVQFIKCFQHLQKHLHEQPRGFRFYSNSQAFGIFQKHFEQFWGYLFFVWSFFQYILMHLDFHSSFHMISSYWNREFPIHFGHKKSIGKNNFTSINLNIFIVLC